MMNDPTMDSKDHNGSDDIYSKVMRAGRRTYFFDVRATRADDYYLTITESKKHSDSDGNGVYRKHKIYLYKEDFEQFKDLLDDVTKYIIAEKGAEVISDTHNPNFQRDADQKEYSPASEDAKSDETVRHFTDIDYDDI